MVNVPLYAVGDPIYLKESASIGFLEGYKVDSVHNSGNSWAYVIQSANPINQSPPLFGERISFQQNNVRYFTEEELVSELAALLLIKINLEQRLTDVTHRIVAKYPDAAV